MWNINSALHLLFLWSPSLWYQLPFLAYSSSITAVNNIRSSWVFQISFSFGLIFGWDKNRTTLNTNNKRGTRGIRPIAVWLMEYFRLYSVWAFHHLFHVMQTLELSIAVFEINSASWEWDYSTTGLHRVIFTYLVWHLPLHRMWLRRGYVSGPRLTRFIPARPTLSGSTLS